MTLRKPPDNAILTNYTPDAKQDKQIQSGNSKKPTDQAIKDTGSKKTNNTKQSPVSDNLVSPFFLIRPSQGKCYKA